jgi:hypothetical protein
MVSTLKSVIGCNVNPFLLQEQTDAQIAAVITHLVIDEYFI